MRFFCPACGTAHTMADDQVPAEGTKVACSRCAFQITVRGKKPRTATVPSLAPPEEPGDRTPTDDEDQPTQAVERPAPAAEAPAPAATRPRAAAASPSRAPSAAPAATSRPSSQVGPRPKPSQPAPAASKPEAKPQPKPQPKPEPHVSEPPDLSDDGEAPAGDELGQAVGQVEDELRAAAGQAASQMKAALAGGLPFPGTVRSGDRYRFRDLLFALRAPLDVRKLAVSAAGFFCGGLLFVLIAWLGVLTKTGPVVISGMVLGGFWACLTLGLAVASRQSDLEARAGKKLPLGEGLGYVRSRWLTVLGTPFLFVVGILALGVGIAVFILLARIPYAGPLVFGLAFLPVFLMAFLAVLLAVALWLVTFTYVPAGGESGPWTALKRTWAVLRGRPGPYLLHFLVAALVTGGLLWLLGKLVHQAFTFISMVDGFAGGGEVSRVLLSIPGALYALIELIAPSGLGAGAGASWEFTIAGWLAGLGMLAVASLVVGFGLTYFQAAGVVSHHLNTQDSGQPGARS